MEKLSNEELIGALLFEVMSKNREEYFKHRDYILAKLDYADAARETLKSIAADCDKMLEGK